MHPTAYCGTITAMTSRFRRYDVIANLGQHECNKLRTTYCDVANIEVRADKSDIYPSDNWRQFSELPLGGINYFIPKTF